jgi:hypothetical protein
MAESKAAKAPRANQMDTSPGTMPSITSSTIISTSHIAGILNTGVGYNMLSLLLLENKYKATKLLFLFLAILYND